MAKNKKQKKHEKEEDLKGAFASVMVLGAIIVVMWFGVYYLFLSR